jgi:hypothetical protein
MPTILMDESPPEASVRPTSVVTSTHLDSSVDKFLGLPIATDPGTTGPCQPCKPLDRRCTPVRPMGARRYALASLSDGLGFRGVVEKEDSFVST